MNLILLPKKLTEHRKKMPKSDQFFLFVMPDCLKSDIIANQYIIYESITMDFGLLWPCENYVIFSNYYLLK